MALARSLPPTTAQLQVTARHLTPQLQYQGTTLHPEPAAFHNETVNVADMENQSAGDHSSDSDEMAVQKSAHRHSTGIGSLFWTPPWTFLDLRLILDLLGLHGRS